MCEICDMKRQADATAQELKILKQKIDIATAQFTLAVDEKDRARQNSARDQVMELTGQSFDKFAELIRARDSMEEALRRAAENQSESLSSLFGGHGPH